LAAGPTLEESASLAHEDQNESDAEEAEFDDLPPDGDASQESGDEDPRPAPE
jgi:hypothetical protein